MRADLVTVYHNATNYSQHRELREALENAEPDGDYRFTAVDNRTNNRGFAKACNLGAFGEGHDSPVIGFLNPDLRVQGPFLTAVEQALDGVTVITGCRFDKPDHELRVWGVNDWVCGAALFVQRYWFAAIGGFDEQFVWGWDETDLIRTAQSQGLKCRSIPLPITHSSPTDDSTTDANYKEFHFQRGARRFYSKWGTNAV